MHAWFALNPLPPAIVEVKGVHQFEWLTRDNVPVLEAMESSEDIKYYYHGDHAAGTNISQYSPTILAAYLQARSPKYISIMNHLRIYLPDVSFFTLTCKPEQVDNQLSCSRQNSFAWCHLLMVVQL